MPEPVLVLLHSGSTVTGPKGRKKNVKKAIYIITQVSLCCSGSRSADATWQQTC